MGNLEHHLTEQLKQSELFFWHRLRWRSIRKYFPENETFRLLDVGAGAGLCGTFLKRKFPLADYAFIEPLETLRAHLQKLYGPANDFTEATKWPPNIQFVTLLDVLEHQKE